MFGSKERDAPSEAVEATTSTRSFVASGMSVKGDIEGDIDLLLEGRLEGNLRCRSVTIGKSGELVGKLQAQEAIIDGRVEGDIEAKTVKLNVTAVMLGDVRHDVIEVAAGAQIDGRYSRNDGKTGRQSTVKSPNKTQTAEPPPKAPAAGLSKSAKADKPAGKSTDQQAGEVVPLDKEAKAG